MNVEIKSIKVVIGKREIELTIDEAKELQNKLNNVLGQSMYYPYIVERQVNYPSSPFNDGTICSGLGGSNEMPRTVGYMQIIN